MTTSPNQDPGRDLQYAAGNILVGGLTAGIASAIRGRPITTAVIQGSFGGAMSYLAKRITAENIPASGLVGRQLGAVGASIVRSAAFGSGLMVDTLVLPIGPLRAYVTPLDLGQSRVRVDLEEVAWLAHNLTQDGLKLNAAASLSSGSFVFTSEEGIRGFGDRASGRAAPGVLAVRLDERGQIPESVLAHERVHINQFDYLKITAGLPLEGAMWRGLRAENAGLLKYLEMGIGHWPFQWLVTGVWLPRSRQLFEVEAEYFETR